MLSKENSEPLSRTGPGTPGALLDGGIDDFIESSLAQRMRGGGPVGVVEDVE